MPQLPPRKPALPPGLSPKPRKLAPGARPPRRKRKEFASDQDVRWCPGCGDYAILAAVQRLLPQLQIKRENLVFISGIGCSSRFPYYMNTYGVHSIHGRAPTVATGLKASRPDLEVWVVTGDGDALSIGGNHLIHALRRNVDLKILLFNNQIYGLTKGQYSPTSEIGKVTKSSPYGSAAPPFNPVSLALGASATFVARTMDRDVRHLTEILKRSHSHTGGAFVEIYQNCNIYNDGAFFDFTEKATKAQRTVFIDHGKPMLYDNGQRGIRLDGFRPVAFEINGGPYSASDAIVYDETSLELASIVSRMSQSETLPRPFGIFYCDARPTYESVLDEQIDRVTKQRGRGDLSALLHAGDTWEIV